MSYTTLTPAVFHILLALAREDQHGYGIMQDVLQHTGGEIDMGPGTLYGCLKRMLAAGLVAEVEEVPEQGGFDSSDFDLNKDRRRYYRLTAEGRKSMRAEAERLAAAVSVAHSRKVLAGGGR